MNVGLYVFFLRRVVERRCYLKYIVVDGVFDFFCIFRFWLFVGCLERVEGRF